MNYIKTHKVSFFMIGFICMHIAVSDMHASVETSENSSKVFIGYVTNNTGYILSLRDLEKHVSCGIKPHSKIDLYHEVSFPQDQESTKGSRFMVKRVLGSRGQDSSMHTIMSVRQCIDKSQNQILIDDYILSTFFKDKLFSGHCSAGNIDEYEKIIIDITIKAVLYRRYHSSALDVDCTFRGKRKSSFL